MYGVLSAFFLFYWYFLLFCSLLTEAVGSAPYPYQSWSHCRSVATRVPLPMGSCDVRGLCVSGPQHDSSCKPLCPAAGQEQASRLGPAPDSENKQRRAYQSWSHWRSVATRVPLPTSSCDVRGLCFSTHSRLPGSPPGADVEAAAQAASQQLFWHSGRLCCGPVWGKIAKSHLVPVDMQSWLPGSPPGAEVLAAAQAASGSRCLQPSYISLLVFSQPPGPLQP